MKTCDSTLAQIEAACKFFQDPANLPEMLVASEATRYLWQHMANLFRTEQVLRDGPVCELPECEDPSIGRLNVTFADGVQQLVEDYFHSSTMDAMLVLHQGSIVYERYKTMRPFDKHVWFSCTKTLIGTLFAMLEQEGQVDASQPVTHYLPELAGSAWETVTIEQALDMATGLDSTEHEVPDARTNPAEGWYQWAVSLGLFRDTQKLGESPFDVLRRMQRVRPAHTVFEYNSINTFVCQTILERVTGTPLAERVGERFWRRIGPQGDGYLAMSKQGHALGFGFMNSTLRDFARYGMAFTPSQSKLSSEPLVPAAVLKKFHTGLRPEMHGKGSFGGALQQGFPLAGIANRYQWDIVTPDGDLFKAGAGGQGLYISAPQDAVVVFFSTGAQCDEARGAWVARHITQSFRQK